MLTNIRVGPATNSSSSHSIIITDKKLRSVPSHGGFGWDNFTLATRADKLMYLATLLRDSISTDPLFDKSKDAEEVVRELLQPEIDGSLVCFAEYVDHESHFAFPHSAEAGPANRVTNVDMPFAKWFISSIIDNPKAFILGGNDNSDGHPNAEDGVRVNKPPYFNTTVHDYGTYFLVEAKDTDPFSTYRVRYSKDGSQTPKGSRPELIDVKVTDKCAIGCSYCYQGSTPNGKHADYRTLVKLLVELRPTEIAIGGGEPTEWPDLESFIAAMTFTGCSVNVTTRRPAKLMTSMLTPSTLNSLTAIGVSIDCVADLENIPPALKPKVMVHIVLGTHPSSELRDMLAACREKKYPVLLLGYKNDGRGSKSPVHDNSAWVDYVLDCVISPYAVSIDTSVVKEYGAILSARGIDRRLMVREDGIYSMYIDGVTGTYHRSSYLPGKADFRPITTAADVLSTFSSWR